MFGLLNQVGPDAYTVKRVPESGVTDCACCGDHIMVNDIAALNFCGDCREDGCTERQPECD